MRILDPDASFTLGGTRASHNPNPEESLPSRDASGSMRSTKSGRVQASAPSANLPTSPLPYASGSSGRAQTREPMRQREAFATESLESLRQRERASLLQRPSYDTSRATASIGARATGVNSATSPSMEPWESMQERRFSNHLRPRYFTFLFLRFSFSMALAFQDHVSAC